MSRKVIGIRREDKSIWERRAPIIPEHVKELVEDGITVVVQPSDIRAFSEEEYTNAGAIVSEDLSDCNVVFGVKEIPKQYFREGGTYCFFSHTIKGQPYNMDMLRELVNKKCTLIDYECVTDENHRRLIFFGRHAGMAGMIETLWALGQRLKYEGYDTPLAKVKRALDYKDIEDAQNHLMDISNEIAHEKPFPKEISPIIIGFAGYGHVSRGAQMVLDAMNPTEVEPHMLPEVAWKKDTKSIYKVVFKEEHTVERKEGKFNLQEFFAHPDRYRGIFDRHIDYLTSLVNCIYWTPKSPRLITKDMVKEMYSNGNPKLKVIGDISCDIEGGIEITVKSTDPGDPVFVYEPDGTIKMGVEGKGPVVMAVDILPSEIPRDSSTYFSSELKSFVPEIAGADYTGTLEESGLSDEVKRGVILWRGEFTPDYEYMRKFLK